MIIIAGNLVNAKEAPPSKIDESRGHVAEDDPSRQDDERNDHNWHPTVRYIHKFLRMTASASAFRLLLLCSGG